MEHVLNDVFGENSLLRHCPVVSIWEDFCKLAAEECFSKENDLDGVSLLTETHAVYLRHKAETSTNYLLRRSPIYDTESPRDVTKKDLMENMSPEMRRSLIGFNTRISAARGQGIIERVKDLPAEWTIVQVTSAFDIQFAVNPERHRLSCPPTMYVTRMECGPNPSVITSKVDLFPNSSVPTCLQFIPKSARVTKSFLQELEDIINDDYKVLGDGAKLKAKDYWTKREEHNQRMKVLLNSIETQWLRGWKCFFLGKLFNPEEVTKLEAFVDEMLSSLAPLDLSPRSRSIISLIVGAMPNLDHREVHRMLRDALPDCPRQEIFDLMDAMEKIRETCSETKPCKWKRHPVILILDKRIEGVPWEMLPTLECHPYSRVPSLHFAHSLSVERCTMKEAYIDSSEGYYVVNPDGSLPKTEERMVEYLERRPEIWRGKRGMEVSPEEFLDVIKKHEVLLYSGHGSGSRYMQDMHHNADPLRAVMLLMGCGSVRTKALAAHLDPWGPVYQHLLGRSPCVIGMLWSVTDGECDAVTMKLLDLWLGPAQGRNDTKKKGEDLKTKGLIQFSSRIPKAKERAPERKNVAPERKNIAPEELLMVQGDLLRAWTESRHAATQFMTSAAMVAYGIPVRASNAEDIASLFCKFNNMSLK